MDFLDNDFDIILSIRIERELDQCLGGLTWSLKLEFQGYPAPH